MARKSPSEKTLKDIGWSPSEENSEFFPYSHIYNKIENGTRGFILSDSPVTLGSGNEILDESGF